MQTGKVAASIKTRTNIGGNCVRTWLGWAQPLLDRGLRRKRIV